MRTRCLAALLIVCAAAVSRDGMAQERAVPLNDYARLGQRFTTLQRASAIWVCMPSWSDNEGGLTLTLWDSPQRTKVIARRVLTGVRDNERVELRPSKGLPPGTYYWEISDRTGQTRIGLYCDPLVAGSDDCAYFDGVANRARCFLSDIIASGMPRTAAAQLVAALGPGGTVQQKLDACRQLAVVGPPAAVPALAKLLPDPALSHMARYALESMPGKEAGAALRAALGTAKGKQLIGVINSLAVRRDADAVPKLAALMKSADPTAADAAVVALGRIGTPSAANVLLPALRQAPTRLWPALCEAGLQCADLLARPASGRAGTPAPPSQALSLYDRLRGAGVPRAVRIGAARGAIVARGAAGTSLLRQFVRGADADLRGVALFVAQHDLPGKTVTLALAAELPSAPADTQALLIAALAGRRDPAALRALRAAAASGPKSTRLAAVAALPAMGGASAPALLALLGDTDGDVHQAAQNGLASLPLKEVAAVTAGLLGKADPSSRMAGIALAQLCRYPGGPSGVAATLRDPSADVRIAAAKALEAIGGAAEVKALRDALLATVVQHEAEALEQALAAICGRAENGDELAGLLADAAGTAPAARRPAFYRLLGGLGGARALAVVRSAANGVSGEARSAAFEMLCAWGSDAAALDLLRFAREAADPADRLKALRGVLRMAAGADVPADHRLQLCRDAAGLVQRDEEKRMLLGALAGIPSADALSLAVPYLAGAATKDEACAAIVGIATKLVDGPGRARLVEPLGQVAGVATNAEVAQQARALLERAKRP